MVSKQFGDVVFNMECRSTYEVTARHGVRRKACFSFASILKRHSLVHWCHRWVEDEPFWTVLMSKLDQLFQHITYQSAVWLGRVTFGLVFGSKCLDDYQAYRAQPAWPDQCTAS